MIVAVAYVRDVRLEADGLTMLVDLRALVGPQLTSLELRGFDVELPARDLENALRERLEVVCIGLGVPIDADHSVRLLTPLL